MLFRYKAIVWPLKVRTSRATVAATIGIIWIGSACLGWPALIYSET